LIAPERPLRGLLATYLRPQWPRAATLAVLMLINIGFQLLNPQILAEFIDTALRRGALQALITLALIFLGVALAAQLVSVAETYVAENVGWIATNQLRADLALHCLELDMSFHNARSPGELIERIDGDVEKLGNFFSRFVVFVLGNVLLLFGVLILLFRIDARVGAAAAGLALITLLLLNRLRSVAAPHWLAARQASADLFGFLEERLAGTEDIRANGATDYTMLREYQYMRAMLRKERAAMVLGSLAGNSAYLMYTIALAVSLAFGAYLYDAHAITLGTVYLIVNYTQMLSRPIDQISRQLQDLQQAGAGVARVSDLFRTRSSLIEPAQPASLPPGALSLAFDGVTFGYGAAAPVLRNLSFQLRPGEVLGLLGRTGNGKTTISRLILRLYDPQAGSIRLGDRLLKDLSFADLRSRVGIVTQEIQLFQASLRDNLTVFDRAIPDARVLDALHELGLSDWYASLPRGLDSILAGGGGLSAGQAQLLAFARVFLRDPDLLILDEASSRLDPATERQIEQAIGRLLAGRTAIIIAHRLTTVQRADTILLLERGAAAEYGPRESLLADAGSRFSILLRAGAGQSPL
jgi:ATP-binding cassette, subfamily B, bacterial